jgi:hypothetical protein
MVMTRAMLAPLTKTSPGTNGRKYITIHETANRTKGANAAAHARLQATGNVRNASWHWQVDDKEAIQSFPHTARCWHAGDGGGPGNYSSIAIEICVNADGDFKRAVRNAAELTRAIMKAEGIPLSRVVQHSHWSGKDCPNFLRDGSQGITWSDFLAMVAGEEDDMELTDLIGTVNPADGKTPSTVGAALAISQNYTFYNWELLRALNTKIGALTALTTNLATAIANLSSGEEWDQEKFDASLNRIIEQVDESIAAALAEGAEFDVNVTVTPKEDETP